MRTATWTMETGTNCRDRVVLIVFPQPVNKLLCITRFVLHLLFNLLLPKARQSVVTLCTANFSLRKLGLTPADIQGFDLLHWRDLTLRPGINIENVPECLLPGAKCNKFRNQSCLPKSEKCIFIFFCFK